MSFRLKALTLVVLLGMAGGIENASAQQLAVKTNLLYDAEALYAVVLCAEPLGV